MFCVWGPLRAQGRAKLFNTELLLPTFEKGTVCFMSGGPYGPKGGGSRVRQGAKYTSDGFDENLMVSQSDGLSDG